MACQGASEVDSLQEWGAFIGTMLMMQPLQFDSLMMVIKDWLRYVSGERKRERAWRKAEATQSRVLALLERLGSSP